MPELTMTRPGGGLPALLRARQRHDDLVAFGAAGARSAADLWRDVAKVAHALPPRAPGAEVLLVIRQDRYALAVAILAAWQREYTVVLPPEHDREAITTLAGAAQTASVLHDTASGIALQLGPLLDPAASTSDVQPEPLWKGAHCLARSYGRDSERQLIPEPWGHDWLGQAERFAAGLAAPAGQRWATSVAPTHAHGVIVGVLAPLVAGGAFLREPLRAHELGQQLPELHVDVLVSVPAHIRELLEALLARGTARFDGASGLTGPRPRLISALRPLEPELAQRAEALFGAPVEDLAGCEGLPILGAGSERVSSAEDDVLLRFVRAQPGVRDAAVLALGGPGQPSHCVAVAGEVPPSLQAALSARAPGAELLGVREIRRDAIGCLHRNALLRLFRRRPSGEPIRFDLHWGPSEQRPLAGATEHRAPVQVPADYPYFDGHFPGYPILPGAAQLSELVLPFVRRVRPDLGRLTHMARLKFSGRIQPGDTIEVVLEERPGQSQLEFTLRRGPTLCAAGTLGFEAGAEV
jgi:hypothetical protein